MALILIKKASETHGRTAAFRIGRSQDILGMCGRFTHRSPMLAPSPCDEKGWLPFSCSATAGTNPSPSSTPSDLLELNGPDPRREPIELRKATLASILRKTGHGVRLNEHLEHDCGPTVFRHACRMGLEGIVSKRLGSRYRSGRSPDWLKFKTREAPAVRAETEDEMG